MCAGIEATMSKESSYACALALSTYTEVMGGLVTGNLRKEQGESQNNFEAFLPYLGDRYKELDNLIKTQYPKKLKSIFHAVRSKLVHEFALRGSHFIVLSEIPNEDTLGIELQSNYAYANNVKIQEYTHINFHIREYYRDFRKGITKYYNELQNIKENQERYDKFLNATVENHIPTDEHRNFDNYKSNY